MDDSATHATTATDIETATATILVTDVVGSTALRQRLGEEQADDARRRHEALLCRAVERTGGTVVKNLGDGVLGRFTSAADAVTAAVRIQQEADVASRRAPESGVDVRVGISAGDVTLEAGDCFGTPVIEASRLCDAATGGQVLAAALVPLLARGRGDHRFVPMGDLELKGIDAPVSAVEVEWTRAPGVEVPLPSTLRENARFPFTGRADALAHIVDRWNEVQEGARHVVLVSGEPGVGKTRLVSEAAKLMHDEGGIVLLGRADESVQAPMRPVGAMLDHLLSHVADELLDSHLSRHDDRLAGLAPSLRLRRPEARVAAGSDDDRVARMDAATDILRRAALGSALVLVLDDLHWADDATLHFLRHLAREGSLGRVLVLGTYRDTDLVRSHPLSGVLADLRREDVVERLDLGGLDARGVHDLMVAAAGHDLEEPGVALAATIHRETDGNPFFVGEVLVHLAESGAIEERGGRWVPTKEVDDIGVPQGIREVVGRRVSGLGPGADEALRAASAIGATFDLSVLARVVGRPETEVLDLLEQGVDRGLLAEAPDDLDRFEFVHALIRTTLYEELSASRRVRLHAAICEALEAVGRDVDVATLAHHACESALVADPRRALDLAVRAVAEAVDALSPRAVTEWWDRAFEMEELLDPADPARRAELLVARGVDERALVELQEAAVPTLLAASDLARSCDRPDLVGDAAVALGVMVVWGEVDGRDVLPLLEEALHDCRDPAQRVRLLRATVTARFADPVPDTRLRLSAESVDVARVVGDQSLLVHALLGHCTTVTGGPGGLDIDEPARLMDEIRGRSEGAEISNFDQMLVAQAEVQVALRHGRLAEAREHVEEYFVLAEERGWWGMGVMGHSIVAVLNAMAGDLGEARAHIAQGWAGLAHVRPIFEVSLRSSELVIHHLAADGARERAAWEAYPDWFAVPALFPWESKLREQEGDLEGAKPGIAEWGQILPLVPWPTLDIIHGYTATAWRAVPAALAEEMRAIWEPCRGSWLGSVNAPVGVAELTLGRLALAMGDAEAAIGDLDRALRIHTDAGEVAYRAHILATLASALIDRGSTDDRSRARDLAEEALEVAKAVGLQRAHREACGALERLR